MHWLRKSQIFIGLWAWDFLFPVEILNKQTQLWRKKGLTLYGQLGIFRRISFRLEIQTGNFRYLGAIDVIVMLLIIIVRLGLLHHDHCLGSRCPVSSHFQSPPDRPTKVDFCRVRDDGGGGGFRLSLGDYTKHTHTHTRMFFSPNMLFSVPHVFCFSLSPCRGSNSVVCVFCRFGEAPSI